MVPPSHALFDARLTLGCIQRIVPLPRTSPLRGVARSRRHHRVACLAVADASRERAVVRFRRFAAEFTRPPCPLFQASSHLPSPETVHQFLC